MLIRSRKLLPALLFAIFVLVFVGGLCLAVFDLPITVEFSEDRLKNWVRSLDHWGGAGIVVLMVIHSFVPFPAEIVAFVAGEFYGIVWGTIYSWTGAMLGASLAFALSRYFGRAFVVNTLLSENSRRKLTKWSRTNTTTTLLAVRFIPVIAFNLINYAAGLTNITWWTFLWTTGIGILPLTILFVYLGEKMRGATLSDWLYFVVGAAIVLLTIKLLGNWMERRVGVLARPNEDQQ